MKRKRIVRLQLLLLMAVVALLAWRMTRGPATPAGVITISELEPAEVAGRSFEVAAQTAVTIDAVGSVESEDGNVLAAHGWIVRSDSRELVWEQNPRTARHDRTLITSRDSVVLAPGRYDAYFTTYGSRLDSREGRAVLGLRPHWTNDAKNWRLVVSAPADVVGQVPFTSEGWDADALWSSGTLGNRETRKVRLQAARAVDVRIYAVLEICPRGCDTARITDLATGETVWQLDLDNSVAAGGLDRNRSFDRTIRLESGLYEAVVETNRAHAARNWRANPPHDPLAWGMRLYGDREDLSEFDPWQGPESFVSFREVGNEADLEAVLDVQQTSTVIVAAMGEVGSGDTVYDYAWLERAATGDRIWEMSVDASEPAGGDRTNRQETVILELEPDRYLLRYVSDGSHAFGDFRRGSPDVPSRWGVSLFPLIPAGLDSTFVRVESTRNRAEAMVSPTGPGGTMPEESALLFGSVRLGNDAHTSGRFTLPGPAKVRVIAVGEISESDRYDYGWIERDGHAVWEMTRRNTEHAGGNDINRVFDGILDLDAGDYEVRFDTDFSHSYGDFGGGGPRDAEGWGIRVYLVEGR